MDETIYRPQDADWDRTDETIYQPYNCNRAVDTVDGAVSVSVSVVHASGGYGG